MCALYPLEKIEDGYNLVISCSLSKLKEDQEPLKSLIEIFKKYDVKLTIKSI